MNQEELRLTMIVSTFRDKLIELDKEWAERVVEYNIDKGLDYVRMVDVAHDINGILQEDEHFLPRL